MAARIGSDIEEHNQLSEVDLCDAKLCNQDSRF